MSEVNLLSGIFQPIVQIHVNEAKNATYEDACESACTPLDLQEKFNVNQGVFLHSLSREKQ